MWDFIFLNAFSRFCGDVLIDCLRLVLFCSCVILWVVARILFWCFFCGHYTRAVFVRGFFGASIFSLSFHFVLCRSYTFSI